MGDMCTPDDRMGHFMTAVGYGADYILFKNSWGLNWGEKGYIKWSIHSPCKQFDYILVPSVGFDYPKVPGAPEAPEENYYPDYCNVGNDADKPPDCFLPMYCFNL